MLYRPNPIRALKISSTFTALLIYTAVNFLVATMHPLALVNFSNGHHPIDQDFILNKLEIVKASDPPDVLLLGSSLAMIATFCADSVIAPIEWPVTKNAWRAQTEAKYLEHALAKSTGKNYRVFNFSGPGGLVNEHCQVLQKLIKIGRAPKVAIMCLGYRDYLGGHKPRDIWRSYHRDWSANKLFGSVFRLYAARQDYQTLASCVLAELLYNSCDPVKTINKLKAEEFDLRQPPTEEKIERCLAGYRQLYAHLDQTSAESEISLLSSCLRTARQHGIKVVIVQMPLTERNRRLLPKSFCSELSNRVEKVCRLENASYLEYAANPSFTQDDFMDSCHLTRGAYKVFDLLAQDLNAAQSPGH